MKRIISVALFFLPVIVFAWPAFAVAGKPVIRVDNVAELYEAVNNPANMNVVVKLKKGVYALTAAEINGGRLLLQPGMDLVGCNKYKDCNKDGVWDPYDCSDPSPDSIFVNPGTETVIDGAGISSDNPGDLIVVGHHNLIKRLTIKNMPYEGYALIGSSAENNQNDAADRKFRVVNCLLENEPGLGIAMIGIDCANSGHELDGAKTSCIIKRNIVRNLPNVVFGFTPDGFKIRNDSVDNAEICAILKGNRAYNIPGAAPDTGHGLAVYGTDFFGGNDCKIKTVSIGNIYSQCGVGTVVFGAQPLGPPFEGSTFTASGNSVHVTAIGDRNVNNYTQGGVVMAGAFALGGEAYDNNATVHMLQTHFVSGVDPENAGQPQGFPEPIRQDLFALGGVALGPFGTAKGNKATLLLIGNTSDNENDADSSFFIIQSDPDNEMNLIGSEEMVEKLNKGVYLTIF